MYKQGAVIFFILLLSMPVKLLAGQTVKDRAEFTQVFTRWTNAFNRREEAASCGLFSPRVVANYRGVPQKNYTSICDGFKKIFQDKNKNYHYRFVLHDIYRAGDLAAVRITWYLQVNEDGKAVSSTQDEGIDVLEKSPTGKWEIVNYLAYALA